MQISKRWREVWGNVLRCRGTGKAVGMCVEVWGQVRESVGEERRGVGKCVEKWGR